MVVRRAASRKDGRTGQRSKLTRAGSSGTLSHDDALPRRIRTTSRTAPRGCGRRRHRAHPDSPLLGEIDAHAPPGRTRRPRPHQRCVPGRTEREEHDPHDPRSPDHHTPMTARRTYVVACLAGHGIGPEITAAASRALARLAREHGFDVEELHPPFDTEALTRSGHLLPTATRQATSSADAVLVAGDAAPALEGLRAALDLGARVTRVLDDTGEATTFAPLHDEAADWTLERAFATARNRSGRLTSVGRDRGLDGARRPACRAASRRRRGARAAARGAPPADGRLRRRARRGRRPGRRGRRGASARRTPAARRVRAALADRAEPVRPGAGNDQRPRGPRRRRPEPDAAGDGPPPVGGARPQPPRARRWRRASRRRSTRRGARPRSRAPASARPRGSSSTRCSACCGAPVATPSSRSGSAHEDDRRRRDPPLPRGRGRRRDVRHPRRGDHADLRRDRARHDRAPRARAPRAGRGPHGARATPARRAVSASPSRPRGRARPTSSPRSPTRGWTRRRSSASRARCARA